MTDKIKQLKKILNKPVDSLENSQFKVRVSNSALGGLAIVYTIDGIEGFDAQSFLDSARENITRVLRENRETKVKLIHKCNIKNSGTHGDIVVKQADFYSNKHINLEGTDEDDIYIIMTERILEKMDTFQSMGSGWRLYSIIKLELRTTRYSI